MASIWSWKSGSRMSSGDASPRPAPPADLEGTPPIGRPPRMPHAAGDYRPHIDGLRGIAVATVILFHAHVPGFAGGFVGVDVFFVISGFLITSIIDRELASGRFSFANFYERRVRRIVPALCVVMAACIPPAVMLLSPDALKDFAQSLVAVVLCCSNVLFWAESGYFDTQAELKPLLHTWSLGVEEQFYLVYPPVVIAARRFGRRAAVAVLCLIGCASLATCVHQVAHDPATAFYMLPSRAWQLIVGGLAAQLTRSYPPRRHATAELVGAAGLGLIAAAVVLFDQRTIYPGAWAIVPTAGAAFVVVAASPDTLAGRLLCWRPLVGLGLVSYSAYLWHQPLFAFVRNGLLANPSPALTAGLCLVTLGLAVVTWRFVEQPFRDRNVVPRMTALAAAAAGLAFFLGVGLVGHLGANRITAARLRGIDPALRAGIRPRAAIRAELDAVVEAALATAGDPFSGRPGVRRVLILGDSVSKDLCAALVLESASFPGHEFRRVELDEPCMAACAALVTSGRLPDRIDERTCRRNLEALRDGPLLGDADEIVLCANWARFITHTTHEGAMMLAEALAGEGRDVRIVGLFAIQDASSLAFLAALRGLSQAKANDIAYASMPRTKIDLPNAAAREVARRFPNCRYLDKYALFCDDDTRSVTLYDPDGRLLFFDMLHLTVDGLHFYGRAVADRGWFRGPGVSGSDAGGP